MLTVQLLYGFLNAILRIVFLLLLDPINMFCLVFLFLNTWGYILVLMVIASTSHKSRWIESGRCSIKSGKAKLERSQLPKVSFIIPAHNEEKTIERKLKNTYSLNYPKDRLEVIVVDDGSTDKTPSILKKIQSSWLPKLKIITQSREGKSSAENKGLQNSNGEIIVISDADVPLNPDALQFMIEDFEDPIVGGVSCSGRAHKNYVLALNLDLGLYARKLETEIDSTFGMGGPFVSFRRTIIPKIPERIFSSDADIGVMIRKRGYKVITDPRIESDLDRWVEGRPRTVIGQLRKLKHMSFGSISLFIRHKDVLFRSRYGIWGWVIAPRYLLNVFTPVIFMLLSVNLGVKLTGCGLLLPFSLLVAVFLMTTFLCRKMAPSSFISRVLFLIFMYVVEYYAHFFYYLVFLLRPGHRRGVWVRT